MELFSNEKGQDVCLLSTDYFNGKEYPDNYIVVREMIRHYNICEIAVSIYQYIMDHAGDNISGDNVEFCVAFPFLGGQLLKLTVFTQYNMDEYAEKYVVAGIANAIISMTCRYFRNTYKDDKVYAERFIDSMPTPKDKYYDVLCRDKSLVNIIAENCDYAG